MSDRSLDEFVTGDESDDAGVSAGHDPATPTMRWAPDGAACAACGEAVARRWRDGDAFVCADCKEW